MVSICGASYYEVGIYFSYSILSGCYDRKVYLWCGDEQVAVMEGHSRPVTDVKWINDIFFLSASQDQGVYLWKVHTCYNHRPTAV